MSTPRKKRGKGRRKERWRREKGGEGERRIGDDWA